MSAEVIPLLFNSSAIISLNVTFFIFVPDIGHLVTNLTYRGILYVAIFPLQKSIISSSVASASGFSWMYATGTSTYRSSGAATTCANATAGWVIRNPSTSAAETFSPQTFNMSFNRETNVTLPSGSISQISPVRKKPRSSKTSLVNSGSLKYPSNIFGPRYHNSPTLP